MEYIKKKPISFVMIVFSIILFLIGIVWIFLASPVDKGNTEEVKVVIESGTYTREIANILKDKELIKSTMLFKVYIKVNNVTSLKADTYVFSRGMSLGEIVDTLENGSLYNPDMIKLTFKEGNRITDYAKVISNNTNNSVKG